MNILLNLDFSSVIILTNFHVFALKLINFNSANKSISYIYDISKSKR